MFAGNAPDSTQRRIRLSRTAAAVSLACAAIFTVALACLAGGCSKSEQRKAGAVFRACAVGISLPTATTRRASSISLFRRDEARSNKTPDLRLQRLAGGPISTPGRSHRLHQRREREPPAGQSRNDST